MRVLLFCAVLLASFSLPSVAAETGKSVSAAKAEGLRLAANVRRIFEEKCLDCHSAKLARPKGKFGYVLDLQRVADNPDYIVRGHPEKSDLYKMVRDEEMPGEDAKVPPLTATEKDVVKRWIEAGAPAAPPLPTDLKTASEHGIEPTAAPLPWWKQALRWVGKFHPATTHFPVALMIVAVLAEGLAWRTRSDSWLQTIRFLVFLAAATALVSGVLGWLNAAFSSYSKEAGGLLWWHRWVSTGSAVWTIICAALLLLDPCTEGTHPRQRFRGALVFGAVLIAISGFLGSALIYGLDHYAWR